MVLWYLGTKYCFVSTRDGCRDLWYGLIFWLMDETESDEIMNCSAELAVSALVLFVPFISSPSSFFPLLPYL